MTPVDLDALTEALAKATPGPWEIREVFSDLGPTMAVVEPQRVAGDAICFVTDLARKSDTDTANGELIVALINAAPAMIAEITALREQNARVREADFGQSMHDDQAFIDAWAQMERRGYMYGEDALENVHLGWLLTRSALTTPPVQPDSEQQVREARKAVSGLVELHHRLIGEIEAKSEIRPMWTEAQALADAKAITDAMIAVEVAISSATPSPIEGYRAGLEAERCGAVSDEAINCLRIRSQLNRAIYSAVRRYDMGNMSDADDHHCAYPLVDLMSNPAPADIETGEMEMVALTDEIESAIRALATNPTTSTHKPEKEQP